MMAGDVSPNHNDIWATDVNRDYVVSPLDALLIINDLNIAGSRKLDPNFDPSKVVRCWTSTTTAMCRPTTCCE